MAMPFTRPKRSSTGRILSWQLRGPVRPPLRFAIQTWNADRNRVHGAVEHAQKAELAVGLIHAHSLALCRATEDISGTRLNAHTTSDANFVINVDVSVALHAWRLAK